MTSFLIHDDWLNRSPAVFALANRHANILFLSFFHQLLSVSIHLAFFIDALIGGPLFQATCILSSYGQSRSCDQQGCCCKKN